MIRAGEFAGDEEIRRFHAEAEAAAKLDHPGIVPIYDVGDIDGRPFFAMSFVAGQNLASRLEEGPLSCEDAAELTIKIAQAVAFAHERQIIHRDLKPANVMLDASGEPRITDFGLAKQMQTESEMTATGQILGTPAYMPPEQALGRAADVDERADIYSLGAILYALITGRPPFQAATTLEVVNQVVNDQPKQPTKHKPEYTARS